MSTSRSLVPLGQSTELNPNVAYDAWRRVDDVPVEPNGFLALLRRHRLKILAAVAVGALAGFLLAYLTPPTYRAQAQIEFQRPSSESAPGAASDAKQAGMSDEFIQTQLGIIRSRSLAQKVADSLPFDRDRRFAAALAPAVPGSKKAAPVAEDDIVDRLRNSVAVEVDGTSRLATISLVSRDPAVSAAAANAYVGNYIESNLQRQYDTTVNSREFLQARLGDAKRKLETSEAALIKYTRAAGLIDPSAGTSSVTGASAPHTLASEDLSQLNQSYAQARADRIAAEQRWQEAQRTPLMSLPEVLANPTIQQLSQKSAEAQAAYQQQRSDRLDTHPAVMAAAAQIQESNRQIATIANNIRGSIRDRYEVARRQEADLARNVGRLKSQTLSDQGKGVKYNVLKREADSNRQLYEGLFRRFNEVSTAAGLIATDAAVVDQASRPSRPVSPNPPLWTVLGALAGILLALAYAIVAYIRDQHVHSPESLDANLNLKVLGVLPRVRNPALAFADPGSPLCEAHYSLRAALEAFSTQSAARSILFTSSKVGEGKSTVAFGVARDFALSGHRTLLVDGDMRKPSVQDHVETDSPMGLSMVLSDLCTAESAILPTMIPGLSVMLAGPMPASPAALLSNHRFDALLKHLCVDFDVVIIDAPPVLGLVDSPQMASAAQQTVFVVESDSASLPEVRGALQRLLGVRANVIGAVLTKFDIGRSGSRSNLYVYNYPRAHGRPRLELA